MVLKNVQALRGVAAGIVFVIHLLSTKPGLGADGLLYAFWWVGPAGVDLFFVISGFIVCLTAARAGRRDRPAGVLALNFAARRFLRIYPLYWIVLLAAFVAARHVSLAAPGMSPTPVWRLIGLMTTSNDKVMLAWTLTYEIFFYGVLALIVLAFPKRVFRAVGLWTLLSVALVAVAAAKGLAYFAYLPMSPLILEFCAGCVVAYLVDRGVKSAGWTCLLAGVALFAVMCWVHSQIGNWQPWLRAPLFTLPCALIVYGAVAVESAGGWIAPRWLQRLGDASYSLYLWHQLVLAVLLGLFERLGLLAALPGPAVLALWAVCAVAVGFVSFHLIEKPIQAWAGRRFSDRP